MLNVIGAIILFICFGWSGPLEVVEGSLTGWMYFPWPWGILASLAYLLVPLIAVKLVLLQKRKE